MQEQQHTQPGEKQSATEPTVAQNPNPRANENLNTTETDQKESTENTAPTGSEITDGEAG